MKHLLAALAWILLGAVCRAETLVTENHKVSLTVMCPEGSVTCDRVRYVGVHRKTGETTALTGRTMHTTCADGVTACRFLGYRFKKGKLRYFVWESGQTATLEVRRGRQVLLAEQGEWE